MTRFDANDPAQRRALAAEAVIAHRERASEATVFEAETDATTADVADTVDADAGRTGEFVRLVYAEGVITFECTTEERDRLDDLLADFSVFKPEQPDTRKAPGGTVHVSAVADPKHAADFLDAAFRRVYELPEGYRLWVARV